MFDRKKVRFVEKKLPSLWCVLLKLFLEHCFSNIHCHISISIHSRSLFVFENAVYLILFAQIHIWLFTNWTWMGQIIFVVYINYSLWQKDGVAKMIVSIFSPRKMCWWKPNCVWKKMQTEVIEFNKSTSENR